MLLHIFIHINYHVIVELHVFVRIKDIKKKLFLAIISEGHWRHIQAKNNIYVTIFFFKTNETDK